VPRGAPGARARRRGGCSLRARARRGEPDPRPREHNRSAGRRARRERAGREDSLALHNSDRPQLGYAAREAGALDDLDDALDVLVGEGRLLGETLVRRRAHGDPRLLELAAKVGAVDLLSRRSARQVAAGAVTRRPEGALHRARLAGEDEARRAHAPRDEHWLADLSVVGRDLLRA